MDKFGAEVLNVQSDEGNINIHEYKTWTSNFTLKKSNHSPYSTIKIVFDPGIPGGTTDPSVSVVSTSSTLVSRPRFLDLDFDCNPQSILLCLVFFFSVDLCVLIQISSVFD